MNSDQLMELLETSDRLPKLPPALNDIFEMLKKPLDIKLEEFVRIINQNEHLSTLLLKTINSGSFQLERKIQSVKEAVLYLGMNTVQTLLIAFVTKSFFPDCLGRAKIFSREKYWKHCVGTCAASNQLSIKTSLGDRYKLFAYGLIHDIGIAVLDICLPNIIDDVFTIQQRGVHQIIAEREVMDGLSHADIGAWLCKKLNLPEDFTSVTEYHHKPFLAKNFTEEVKLIHFGDMISTEYYERLLGLHLNHSMNRILMESIKVTQEDVLEISETLPEEVDKLGILVSLI